jgi:hypothetical protein
VDPNWREMMEIGVTIAVAAFGLMSLFAVLVAVIAAVAAVSGFENPEERE